MVELNCYGSGGGGNHFPLLKQRAQLFQDAALDLPNAFPAQTMPAGHNLKGLLLATIQTESLLDHVSFPGTQSIQQGRQEFLLFGFEQMSLGIARSFIRQGGPYRFSSVITAGSVQREQASVKRLTAIQGGWGESGRLGQFFLVRLSAKSGME